MAVTRCVQVARLGEAVKRPSPKRPVTCALMDWLRVRNCAARPAAFVWTDCVLRCLPHAECSTQHAMDDAQSTRHATRSVPRPPLKALCLRAVHRAIAARALRAHRRARCASARAHRALSARVVCGTAR